jgi:hypothetical protein
LIWHSESQKEVKNIFLQKNSTAKIRNFHKYFTKDKKVLRYFAVFFIFSAINFYTKAKKGVSLHKNQGILYKNQYLWHEITPNRRGYAQIWGMLWRHLACK